MQGMEIISLFKHYSNLNTCQVEAERKKTSTPPQSQED